MDFAQAEAYLNGTINEVASPRRPYRLDRMRSLLRALDDPQQRYPTIHIAGTSGKGSTATMIASVLSASGRRTGLHTKPHLRSMTERARIDGAPIAQTHLAELLETMMPAIEKTTGEYSRPSYYETLLALTFLYFAREHVDVAVIEAGIGGRLDGTNVLSPVVGAITNIGLDHTDILGETLEEIAADKAHIAKPNVPLVTGVTDPGLQQIIRLRCEEVGAPFIVVSEEATVSDAAFESQGQRFSVTTRSDRYDVDLPLLGEFQLQNAAMAVVVLEHLPAELRPHKSEIERGLGSVQLSGRMEYIPAHPGVVFDVAHNPDKAAHLAASLASRFGDRRFRFVIAIGSNKDALHIIEALRNLPASFIFTTFRAEGREPVKPQRLASLAESLGVWGRAIPDPVEAFTLALRDAGADDVVVVTGSTFIVGALREWWMENVAAAR